MCHGWDSSLGTTGFGNALPWVMVTGLGSATCCLWSPPCLEMLQCCEGVKEETAGDRASTRMPCWGQDSATKVLQ